MTPFHRLSARGRFGIMRPALAMAMVALLAACGGQQSRHSAATNAAAVQGGWNRPASYDPPGPSNDPWGPYIREASHRFDVPERWIREVMRQESGGRAAATSRAGAMGLMQVMPGTYRELQARYGLGGDPYHPYDNIMAGTAYLREMYELYGSPAFLAAYNAGPRRLEDYLWGGRGLPAETRNYVARVGPRIADAHPNRRAAPEVYAAAEIPLNIPSGPRRGDRATMLALRDQRQAVNPGIRVAQLPAGPVVRMDPIPDGSTQPSAQPVQVAGLGGSVVQMEPVASAGDFQVRMEPLPNPPEPDRSSRTALASAPAPAAPRGLSLIGTAQAGTLPPAATARSSAAAASGQPGQWGVQVGAFASANLARNAANQARDSIALMGTRVSVEPVRQGQTTLYRARVVGLSNRDTASQACDRLRSRGACMVVAPGA